MNNAHRNEGFVCNLSGVHDSKGAGISGLYACHVIACTSAISTALVHKAVIILLPVTESKVTATSPAAKIAGLAVEITGRNGASRGRYYRSTR